MIASFADKDTMMIWEGRRSRRLPADIQQCALARLSILNRVKELLELTAPPSNRLHALTGDRQGQHSISINMQWRVCFTWKDGNAYDVEITDYH
ncbi:type II toxin-antitoxin system RelE/ParE family toxin [Altererythrobacter xixiisoli]|uniref:Type II toxin-antitoxin system RelE/ParE family toxin n=1 Tax=Croceibacterium xixiisoli TaxID=1476466 RepID=A0A6I4TVJ6_9SPHN|nr:type II toxin-antitoxin system RelE/ParE family toxin [Croceibacterium xixiisoli]